MIPKLRILGAIIWLPVPLQRGGEIFYLGARLYDLGAIQMELFAEPINGGEAFCRKRERGEHLVTAKDFSYSGQASVPRPATD